MTCFKFYRKFYCMFYCSCDPSITERLGLLLWDLDKLGSFPCSNGKDGPAYIDAICIVQNGPCVLLQKGYWTWSLSVYRKVGH